MECRIVVFIIILSSYIDTIHGKRNEISKISPHQELNYVCDTEQLSTETSMIVACDKTIDGSQRCLVSDGGYDFVYNCVEESWKLSSGTDHHLRRKRFFFLIPLIFGVVAISTVMYCASGGCVKREVTEPLIPPKYKFCPKSGDVYTASSKDKSVKVIWKKPIAEDDEKVESETQTHKSGDTFQGSPAGLKYTVTYIAKDGYGLAASCSFSFTVKYKRCKTLDAPKHGSQVCSHGFIFGSECKAKCDDGYEIVHKTTATCKADEKWDNIPSCQKFVCQKPFEIANGNVDCNDRQYRFQTVCFFECKRGFRRIGPSRMDCKADRKWSVDAWKVSCIDSEPPRIKCLPPQIFYADRGGFTTSVTWKEPSATDNVDSYPIISKRSTISQGDTLSEGSHFVTYKSSDRKGNTSPLLSECAVELKIKVIKCTNGPYDIIDNPRFIKYNCSDTIYYGGVSCDLECDLNIQINGSERMTCERNGTSGEGVWVWESDQPPFCQVITCPPLEPPDNGAFTTDTVNARPLHVMLCKKGYDSPSVGQSFQGRLSCQDSGKWYPFQEFPDCIKSVFPQTRLPVELIYKGDCNDNSTQERIKAQVLIYLSTVLEDVDQSICPNLETCKVENVVVVCGVNSRRRRWSDQLKSITKRHNENVVVRFDIVVPINIENKTAENAFLDNLDVFDNITGLIKTYISEGKLDIQNYSITSFKQDSSPKFSCADAGYKFEFGSMKCKPCPRGTFLNLQMDTCEFCNIGEYIDHEAATECNVCPEGYSTYQIGSKDQTNCIKLCSPGYMSTTSMEPCNACPVSSYQPLQGQTYCESCPLGTTTKGTNSISAEECDVFDIYIGHSEQQLVISTFDAEDAAPLVLSFWFRPKDSDNMFVSICITDTDRDIICLDISDYASLTFGESSFRTSNGTFQRDRWTHIMCTVNLSSGETDLYIGGALVINAKGATVGVSRTIVHGTVMVKHMSTDFYLSGLLMFSRHIDEMYIRSLSQSCVVNATDKILSMSDLIQNLRQGDSVIMPSTCDAIDECETEVCGIHECINKIDGFECICLQGMKGELCDIPPDYCLDNLCENGDCISENRTYRCNCTDGYTGPFCKRPPLNGGWSEWQEWSSCSSTCGGGTRSRKRKCNSPPPEFMGLDCKGNATEVDVCKDFICPSCTQLNRTNGTLVACNSSEEYIECSVKCVMGKVLANGQNPYEKYKCAQTTGYLWEPTDQLPTCVDVKVPSVIGISIGLDYQSFVPDKDQDAVESLVEQKLTPNKCNTCSLKAKFKPTNLKKGSTSSTLTLQYSSELRGDGNIALADYLTNGTETPAMAELLETLHSLNDIAELIQHNSTAIFDVVVDGVQYTSDNSSVAFAGMVTCPDGYAGADGLCAQCAEGTKLSFPDCVNCEIGTYQPHPGQSDCLSCPDGYTTSHFGSSSISNCSVPLPSTTVRMVTKSDDEKEFVESGWSEWHEWSSCSSTCGGGTRSRKRKCNSPSPGFLGSDCTGNAMEIEVCKDNICPSCTPLNRTLDTLVACNSSKEVKECSIKCVKGKVFANGQNPYEKYKCGQTTGYLWEPTDELPVCVDVKAPSIIGMRISVNYRNVVPKSDKDAIISAVEQKLADIRCDTCSLKAQFKQKRETKRSTTSTFTLQYSNELKGDGNTAWMDNLPNGTETPAMTELLETLRSLNEMAEFIQNNSTDIFDVVVDGVQYTSDNSSISFAGMVTCPDGYAGADGRCEPLQIQSTTASNEKEYVVLIIAIVGGVIISIIAVAIVMAVKMLKRRHSGKRNA